MAAERDPFRETDLLVEDYLKYRQLKKTLAAFVTERVAGKGRLPVPIANPADVLQRILKSFDRGDYPRLLTLWDQYIVRPMETAGREDREMRAVEFYINVHCATYAFRKEGLDEFKTPKIAARAAARATLIFKRYIESRGRRIIKLPEFAPYKVLPEVDFPPQHPSFQHVFMPEWVTMIRERARRFLLFYMKSMETPKLIQLAHNSIGVPGMDSTSFTNTSITASLEFNMNEREEKLKRTYRKRERRVKDICSSMHSVVMQLLQELEQGQVDSARSKQLSIAYRNKFQDIYEQMDGDAVGLSFTSADIRRSLASVADEQEEISNAALTEIAEQSMNDQLPTDETQVSQQQCDPESVNPVSGNDLAQSSRLLGRDAHADAAFNSHDSEFHASLQLHAQQLEAPGVHLAALKAAINDRMLRFVEYVTAHMKEATEPLPHSGCDVVERRAMDISLLLQALLQLLRRSPDGDDNHAVMLTENSAKLDLLGLHGAPNVLGSVISLCDFLIDNPSQQLYCEDSGRHRRIVRSVNVLVDYVARAAATLAEFPTGLRYCTHNDMLASDLYESLSWKIDEYANIDEICMRTDAQRTASCLVALAKLSADPTVQRSLVNRGIIQWLVARMQEQLGLELIDASEAVECLNTTRQIAHGPLLGAALELLQYVTANSDTTRMLLSSTSGLAIIAKLVFCLIIIAICLHTDFATNAQVCLRNLCVQEDVRQVILERPVRHLLDRLAECEETTSGQANVLQSLADMFDSGELPEVAAVAQQWSLDPILAGWHLPEEKLLESFAAQHSLPTGRALLQQDRICA